MARSWSGIVLALVLSACRTSAFDRASKLDTAAAYREFLRENPKDDQAEGALARLAELEFENAARVHNVIAYKRYLEEFPDSPKRGAATALLEGLRFNAAKAAQTALAYRQFLRDHPDGAHRDEAQRLLAESELAEAERTKDPAHLALIAAAHPDDPRRVQVEQRRDDAVFSQARSGSPRLLFAYLREFPAGAHRDEARAELLSLRIEGLLVSGLLEQARLEARSPLAAGIAGLAARFHRAEVEHAASELKQPWAQSVLAKHYLRSIDDLERALAAPDLLERWQAAEELGHHVSVKALDPLLAALRTARNPLLRLRAQEALRAVVAALPERVAQYELAVRLEAAEASAEDARLRFVLAVMLELAGEPGAASLELQRSFEPLDPDPLTLWLWARRRLTIKEAYSAGVAARQIALWVEEVTRRSEDAANPLASARQLCSATFFANEALVVLRKAKSEKVEFPEDLAAFETKAVEAQRRASARLRDLELVLREKDASVRTCEDRRVAEWLSNAVHARREALASLPSRAPEVARTLMGLARDRDPSPEVRRAAADALVRLGPGK